LNNDDPEAIRQTQQVVFTPCAHSALPKAGGGGKVAG
jgi:hypothetical protein